MKEKKHDWFMALIVVPIALLGAFVIYVGAQDNERIEDTRAKTDSIRRGISKIDSMSRSLEDSMHHELKTLEDSVHYFEDGM